MNNLLAVKTDYKKCLSGAQAYYRYMRFTVKIICCFSTLLPSTVCIEDCSHSKAAPAPLLWCDTLTLEAEQSCRTTVQCYGPRQSSHTAPNVTQATAPKPTFGELYLLLCTDDLAGKKLPCSQASAPSANG